MGVHAHGNVPPKLLSALIAAQLAYFRTSGSSAQQPPLLCLLYPPPPSRRFLVDWSGLPEGLYIVPRAGLAATAVQALAGSSGLRELGLGCCIELGAEGAEGTAALAALGTLPALTKLDLR